MIKDKEVDSLLNQLGELDQEIGSIGQGEMEFSPKALAAFGKESSKLSKAFPQPLAPDPLQQLDTIHRALNMAVEAGVLPDTFACPPVSDEDDLRYLTAKVSALAKDRGLVGDLKDFLFSEASGLVEAPAPELEPEPVSKTPDRLSRLMELESQRRM